MHRRFYACLLVITLITVSGACIWRLGHLRSKTPQAASPIGELKHTQVALTKSPTTRLQVAPIRLLSQPGLLNSQSTVTNSQSVASSNTPPRFAHRLSNTKESVSQLAHRDNAILLENALLDTESALPAIPAELQATDDPGTYIVQAKGPLTDSFRNLLQQAGATII